MAWQNLVERYLAPRFSEAVSAPIATIYFQHQPQPMRILHTADWHLGLRLNGRYRHDEQEAVLDELCRIADDQQIDAVVIAGDVFDTYNPPTESESLFYRTMTRLSNGGPTPTRSKSALAASSSRTRCGRTSNAPLNASKRPMR